MLNQRGASYSWKFPVADTVYQFISCGYACLLRHQLSGPTVHTFYLLIPTETQVSLNFLVSQPSTEADYYHVNAEELPTSLTTAGLQPLTTVVSSLLLG